MAKYEEYMKKEQEHQERITSLKQEIKKDQQSLVDINQEYRDAVAAGDDDSIDPLFMEMEKLQKKIKADNHKLETLKSVTNEHLKKSALKLLEGYKVDVEAHYQGLADKVNEKIKKAKKDYSLKVSELMKEISKINEEYNQDARKYGQVMKNNGIEKKDISVQQFLEFDDAASGVKKSVNVESVLFSQEELQNIQ